MASDNIKIIIQEDNQTRPLGAGTSSDIVYVPGLANETATSLNTPVLCSSLDEFEKYFGTEPYVFTEEDLLTQYPTNGYKVGDYDKSYIYAKELINAGISVMYENVTSTSKLRDIGKVNFMPDVDAPVDNFEDNKNNTFTYTASSNVTTSDTYTLVFQIAGNPYGGGATVLFDFPEVEGIDVTTSSIRDLSGKFNMQNAPSITWTPMDETTFEYARFEVDVTIQYTGDARLLAYTFGVHVVDGAGQQPGGVVAGSKITYFYDNIGERLNNIEDKGEYSIKYITTGGFPSFIPVKQSNGSVGYPIADAMLDCAAKRGDAVALVDHEDNYYAPLRHYDEESVYSKVNNYFRNGGNTSYGAMFTPYADYACTTVVDTARSTQTMPASFGYLLCLARAIKTSPNWLAMAGVARGIVPGLKRLNTSTILSNVIAEDYQPKFGKADNNKVSINAITNIRPYGLTIWGNRTLEPVPEKGTTAVNFLNTRNMVSDIKKVAYDAAKTLMYEQDSDTLWLNFKSRVSPTLEQMKSGNGIADYKIIRGTTKYNGQSLTRGELAAVIRIIPRYAIEYFEITVVMADEEVSVS